MARQLIDNLAAKWNPEKYTDEYRDNLMKIIQAQAQRAQAEACRNARRRSRRDVVDLMARLRASLEGKGAKGGRTTAGVGVSREEEEKTSARKRSHAA